MTNNPQTNTPCEGPGWLSLHPGAGQSWPQQWVPA